MRNSQELRKMLAAGIYREQGASGNPVPDGESRTNHLHRIAGTGSKPLPPSEPVKQALRALRR